MKTLNIQEFIRHAFDIKNEMTIEKLAESAELLRLKKPQLLFEEQGANDRVYVLVEGLMRAYYSESGEEQALVRFYWKPGSVIMGDASFGGKNHFSVAALGHCCVLAFPIAVVKKLIESNFEMAGIYSKNLSASLRACMEEKKAYHFDAPQDRLQWLQSAYPELEEIVQDKYLAEYLNITPVTMSRLRRKIREEKMSC